MEHWPKRTPTADEITRRCSKCDELVHPDYRHKCPEKRKDRRPVREEEDRTFAERLDDAAFMNGLTDDDRGSFGGMR